MIARRRDDRRLHVGIAAAGAAAGGVVLMLSAENAALAAQVHAQTVLTAATTGCPAAVNILNQALQPATITAIAGGLATVGGTIVAIVKALKTAPTVGTEPPAVAPPPVLPSTGGGVTPSAAADLSNRPKVQ